MWQPTPRASKHAEDRVKERMSLPKSAVQKNIERAWEHGLTQGEVKGRVRRFMAGVYLRYKKSTNTRIYNDCVYCFGPDGTLITMYPVPEKLRKTCRRALKNRKTKEEDK